MSTSVNSDARPRPATGRDEEGPEEDDRDYNVDVEPVKPRAVTFDFEKRTGREPASDEVDDKDYNPLVDEGRAAIPPQPAPFYTGPP